MSVFSDTTGKKYLYRYRPDTVYAIDEILNQYVRFSSKESLNDVFEFSFGGFFNSDRSSIEEKNKLLHNIFKIMSQVDGLEKIVTDETLNNMGSDLSGNHLDGNEDILLDIFEQSVQSKVKEMEGYFEKVAISCFCKKPLNATMMGHYSNNSRGLIISYERRKLELSLCEKADLFDVIYSETPYKMKYVDFLGLISVEGGENYRNDLLARKHLDWKYENEVRAIFPNPKKFGNNLDIDSECIAGVCFAPSASDAFKRVVVNICSLASIPVFESVKMKSSYDFEVVAVDEKNIKKVSS